MTASQNGKRSRKGVRKAGGQIDVETQYLDDVISYTYFLHFTPRVAWP